MSKDVLTDELRSHAPTAGVSSLRLDWCSHEAAKYAVEHWHYSRRMPNSKLAKLGVWEGERFVGCVIFGVGATGNIGSPYALPQTQVCELVRVALATHRTPVSRIVAVALKVLKRAMPGLRLVVSYADPDRGHHGGIYQAGNWIYMGRGSGDYEVFVRGRWMHRRAANVLTGTSGGYPKRAYGGRHKYLMPLDAEMRAKLLPLAKPYPKREQSAAGGATGDQPVGGGSIPTCSLEPATYG
jgi:hypothetical protein